MPPVVASADGFFVGGERFPVVGVNAYYLLDETARELRRGEAPRTCDEVFGKLRRLGVTVVRTLAFLDTPDASVCLQRRRGDYDPIGLRALEHVVASARTHGLRLLLVLANYWKDYGGVDQYLRWAGLPRVDKESRGAFFTHPDTRAHYRENAAFILGHTSAGVPLGQDDTVFGWELINEPRGTGASADALAEWVEEMATFVREHATQAIGTGESGYDAESLEDPDVRFLRVEVGAWVVNGSHEISFSKNTAHVDFASVHCYPESWGGNARNAEAIGAAWIRSRASVAARLGKPLIVGEFGLINDDDFPDKASFSLSERRAIYARWFELASDRVALFPWLFVPDERPNSLDRFSFELREGTKPSDLVNKYADLIAAHARARA